MSTLIIKTEGMSAYGLQTFDINRRINHFPTRSALVGLLSAALGIRRDNTDKLLELSDSVDTAVQVNHCGTKISDYHTVQGFRNPQGKLQKPDTTKPTYREYWCDSAHTFAITGNVTIITKLADAVRDPIFTLFQGRKSCPLTRPLFESMTDDDNPVTALLGNHAEGPIYSDVPGDHEVGQLKLRDKRVAGVRSFAMRTVYVCAQNGESL